MLSTQMLFLKQIDQEKIINNDKEKLNLMFSDFNRNRTDLEKRAADNNFNKRFGHTGLESSRFDVYPPRRFAGDSAFERNRYFSVCKNNEGDDSGTLLRELKAYFDPEKHGLIEIFDSIVNSEVLSKFNLIRKYDKSIIIIIRKNIISKKSKYDRSIFNESEFIELPVRAVKESIERVLDLRQPRDAQKFAKRLSKLNWENMVDEKSKGDLQSADLKISGWNPVGFDVSRWIPPDPLDAFPFRSAVSEFNEILPSLLDQSIGGGQGVTQVAGQWLRELGVNGVVYPSARSNAEVVARNRSMVQSSGFCFVDYRAASNPQHLAQIDFGVGWPEEIRNTEEKHFGATNFTIYKNVAIKISKSARRRGSWSIIGLEERRNAAHAFSEILYVLSNLCVDKLVESASFLKFAATHIDNHGFERALKLTLKLFLNEIDEVEYREKLHEAKVYDSIRLELKTIIKISQIIEDRLNKL